MSKVKHDVRVYPIDEPKGSTVAFANVGIADSVAISGIRVVKGSKGNFVSMPQSQDKDGNYHNYASVNNDAVKKEMDKAILAEFKSATRDADGQPVGRTVMAEVEGNVTDKIGAKVYPLKDPKGSTLAFANVDIADLVTINSVRVIEGGENGMFVAMPQSKDKEGNFHDIAFPINAGIRKGVTEAVLDAYGDKTERRQSMSDRLAEGKEASQAYNAAHKADPSKAAKSAPGLGD
jgi:stage V sporulation protein G